MTFKTIRQVVRGQHVRLLIASIAALVLFDHGSGRPIAQSNAIVVENLLPGSADWDISGAGDLTIQGFATDISVNTGQTVNFKIKTDSTNFGIDIYRLGYYGGAGARLMTELGPFTQQQNQSVTCATEPTTGLVDCGNWAVSASWTSTNAVSGIYVAKLTRADGTGGSSHIVFIVRDDARQADVVVQTSDTTWQAYNGYGGGSLYCGGPISNAGSAYVNSCLTRSAKVSYNRPITTRGGADARSFLFSAEYPMVRWLEANGYDVKYWAGVDTDRHGADLTGAHKPKAFFSMGHDEYWSGNQRSMIESARTAGVNLAFFSGNEMYWKTRYENSIDGTATPYRTLVSYKETLASAKIDPAVNVWTGTWRDPRFSPPADGGRPENSVTGTVWTVNSGTAAITIPAAMARLRFWQHTRVAALTSGVATLSPESLGYEWDEDLDNGARPTGLVHLSSTTVSGVEKILDYGATTGVGTATHSLTLYRHATSGALVFGAGTVQWSWGLDATHDGGSPAAHVPDQAMQQSTVNLLADMGVQPSTLQTGLTATSASTDLFPPTSRITSPAAGGQVQSGNLVTIAGTATDNGGGVVTGVEVSVDGGATWQAAQGTAAWSFAWTPGALGSATLRTRAVDDGARMEVAGAGITVSVVAGNCPCTSLWKPTAVPAVASVVDSAIELGVKFKSDLDGFITGVRFYKGPANTGTHQGSLWTLGGTRLALATFTTETPSGWQQVSFATPVQITKNTTYVASYHTNVGGYSADSAYFATTGVDAYPLHAPRGGNGLFKYGASVFPTESFNDTNYWVDVVFAETTVDTSELEISDIDVTVIDGSTAVVAFKTNKNATSRIDYSTPALPGQTFFKTDGASVLQHSLTLTGLTPNATYYFRLMAVDEDGEAAIQTPPSFTVPGPTLHDTASVDFLAGTPTNTYVADGEVILAPTVGSEFSGDTLPAGWIEVTWAPEGYSTIDNGVLLVDGARVATCVTASGACLSETQTSTPSAIYSRPHSLEFSANFSGDQSQHAGMAQTLASGSEPWAIFSTLGGGQLFTRTNTGSGSIDTPLGPGLVGSFHRFRIDWKPTSVDYSVDGALVHTDLVTVAGPLRPVAASDFDIFGGVVFVDWMRMTPYAASGTFLSRVFDANAPVDWHSIQWVANAPLGTSVAISIRTGNTPAPDNTWSAFTLVAAPGPITRTSRYIQYQAAMTTSDLNQTPALQDIIISTDHAPVAANDAAATNVDTMYTFPASGPGSLKFNDSDADASDTLRITAVGVAAHGTAQLIAGGSVTYNPALGFSGDDSFTYTLSDGLMTATATVSMTVGGGTNVNSGPVANDQSVSATEDTAKPITLTASDVDSTFLDDSAGLTYSIVVNPIHGTLAGSTPNVVYTPAQNYNGGDSFTFKANDGSLDSNIATVSITVAAVNDAPSFAAGASQTAVVNSGPRTVANWPIAPSAGPANEATQTLSYIVSNNNPALFSAQPAIAPNGTLTYTSAVNAAGSATVTVVVKDNGGTANGGVDTSASRTFTITVAPATTATALTSTNINSLFGVPITLTANVAAILPATGMVGGSVTFLDGTATLGTGVLTAGVAKFTTSSLAVGTHTIKAVYTATTGFLGSTSAPISQVISPSATLLVKFLAHVIDDNTRKPKVHEVRVSGATVRVYTRWDSCTDGLVVSTQDKKWGKVFDGLDGPGGADPGCPVLTWGTYQAVGTTDANGLATIIVPPTSVHPNKDYVVIGRSFAFDDTRTAANHDAIYSGYTIQTINAGASKNVLLDEIRNFDGKRVAGKSLEEYGTYLGLVAPEEMEWIEDQVLYPVILIAEGDWSVSTSIAPPSGFVPDTTSLGATVSNTTSAVQFTLTDVGSDWTETTVTHVINHKGTTRIRREAVRMINHRRTKAKADFTTVLPNSTANPIDVLGNDHVAPPLTLAITGITQGANGSVTLASDGKSVIYSPNAGFVGLDMFTYAIDDGMGGVDTGTVNVRVNITPSLVLSDATVAEGNVGTTPMTFTVTLSSAVEGEVTFDYTTIDKTAFAGTDYMLASGTLVIPAGETSATITVQIIGNTVYQSNRTFNVKLSNVINRSASIFGGGGKGAIADDDAKPSISVSGVSIVEGSSGTTLAVVTVTLSGSTALPATVDYKTADGTAIAGSDYAAVSGTLTFAPGDTIKTITVSVKGDTTPEANETFSVRLANASAATLTNNRADITITDDDR